MKCFLIFLALLVLYKNVVYGKGGLQFTPVSFNSCEGTEKYINVEFRPSEKGKAWFGNASMPMTLDSKTTFTFEMRWWINGAWEKKAQTIKGNVCFYLEKLAGKFWRGIRAAIKPPLELPCSIKPGFYTLENYIPNYSEINLPMMKKGRWSGAITINGGGKSMCVFLVVDMV